MNQVYMELSERIQGGTTELERLLPRIRRAWEQSMLTPEEFAFLDSVALNLHSFYSGIERLFEMIAKFVDGGIPDGKTWHRDLVMLMTEEIDEVRPAVIGREGFAYLDELRRFRHLVRNVYYDESVIKKNRAPGFRTFRALAATTSRASGFCGISGDVS